MTLIHRVFAGVENAVSLRPSSLMRAAQRLERLEDFGDPSFVEPLSLLVESLEHDAELHVFGRLHLRSVIVRALRTRLRLARLMSARPELDQGPKRAPIVICGLPRSGTTMLHRLLATLPDLHGLPLWQLVEPLPPAGVDRRRARGRRRTQRLQWLSGGRLDVQHVMRADLPDECGHLFRAAFVSPQYAVAPALRYLRAYPDLDVGWAYREYRAYLGLLSGDDPRRLVLKDPFHALFTDALSEALPHAMVVQLHRNPREVVPSFVKLCTTAQRMVSRRRDVPRVAEAIQDWLQTLALRSVDRAQKGRTSVIDVDYRQLTADPVRTVERLHRHFDLPFEPAWRPALQAVVERGRQRPPNPYSAAAFGLDPNTIDDAFAPYVRQFL